MIYSWLRLFIYFFSTCIWPLCNQDSLLRFLRYQPLFSESPAKTAAQLLHKPSFTGGRGVRKQQKHKRQTTKHTISNKKAMHWAITISHSNVNVPLVSKYCLLWDMLYWCVSMRMYGIADHQSQSHDLILNWRQCTHYYPFLSFNILT